MHDLRLELRCRNNLLWHMVFDTYPSVAEFCRANAFRQDEIGGLLNLSKSPYLERDGSLKIFAQRLCDLSGYGSAELFPPDLYSGLLGARMTAEIPSARLLPLVAARRLALPPIQDADDLELPHVMDAALSTLTTREADIIRKRFGFDDGEEHTLEEIGREYSLCRDRIRQIQAKALRKLRHPRHARRLRDFLGTTLSIDERRQAVSDRIANKPGRY